MSSYVDAMRSLVISGLKQGTSVQQIDELLRVFHPHKVQIYDDGATKKALAYFPVESQIHECAEILNLRPDLVQRRLGADAKIQPSPTNTKPALDHLASIVYGASENDRDERDDFRTSDTTTQCEAYHLGCSAKASCPSCAGEIDGCLMTLCRDDA